MFGLRAALSHCSACETRNSKYEHILRRNLVDVEDLMALPQAYTSLGDCCVLAFGSAGSTPLTFANTAALQALGPLESLKGLREEVASAATSDCCSTSAVRREEGCRVCVPAP